MESPPTPMYTFVIRMWLAKAKGQTRCYGRIEHIPTGTSTAFAQIEEIVTFVQEYVETPLPVKPKEK